MVKKESEPWEIFVEGIRGKAEREKITLEEAAELLREDIRQQDGFENMPLLEQALKHLVSQRQQ